MNDNQKAVLKSALLKCIIVAVVLVSLLTLYNITIYNIGAKNDAIVSSIASQQLSDGGQAYQQIKMLSQNYSEIISFFSWIRVFVIVCGIGYIGYQAFNAYRKIKEL